MSKPANKGGRPPSRDPRFHSVHIRLTDAEAAELEVMALEEGTTLAAILRRAIPTRAAVSRTPRVTRRA